MKLSDRNSAIGKLIRYYGFGLCLFIQMTPIVYSQLQWQEGVKIHEKSFSEVLYLRTDRDMYAAGEKVWFSVYKQNGLTLAGSDNGKVAYVDILDLENNPVDQLKIEITGNSGSGSFILPDTLRTGNYIIRAYTNWMQNFSKDLFAYESITVINPFDKITNFSIPFPIREPDSVIFYPEGGHLQAGVNSLLGFKIFDRQGNPVKMKGFMADENNDTVCRFQTGNNGYGLVSLKPAAQDRISLISSETGLHRKFPLPDVSKEGILLTSVKPGENSPAVLKLNASVDFVSDAKKIYLEITSSGLSGVRKNIISERNQELLIGAKDLPYGLSHLSIVDERGTILTDRWVSRESDSLINYKITVPDNGHSTRKNIRLDITATDLNGNPVKSNFSVSVVKSVTANRRLRGFEHCRQLPGMSPVIEDCDLKDVNDFLVFYKSHDQVSDRSMNGQKPGMMYLPELEGHLISGNLRDKASGEPLRNENITLSFVGKTAQCLFTKTDSIGNFNFVTNSHGLKEIVIQPLTSARECYVDLNNPFPSGYNDYNHGVFSIDTNYLDNINNVIISMQINNIYEPFLQKQSASGLNRPDYNFYGPPDNSILMSKYIELTSVKEIVAELIPGVVTTKTNGKINFRLTKPYQSKPYENGPLVLVDGIPVYDLNKVIGINSNEIEKVDVLIDRYFISGNVIDGILHFITKKGNLSSFDLDRAVFRMEYDLLENNNDFYSPDYSIDSLKNNRLPDFRNTLYWNPDLHTDSNGKASAKFFSSDESGEYLIVIDGLSEDGRTGKASIPLIIKGK